MARSLRPLAMLAATLMLAAACSYPYGTIGLGAIDPLQIRSEFGRKDIVASLTPTLIWDSFPQRDDAVQSAALAGRRVDDVTYELRLWPSVDYGPGPLAYERRGLTQPRHKIEAPLEPSRLYYWSVRARFRLDGRERVTQWASRVWLIFCKEPSRRPIVPNRCAYFLMTPEAKS